MPDRPRFAKTYEVRMGEGLFIDGEPLPWYVALEPEWRVQPIDERVHVLWLPVLIDGPCPEYGEPEGVTPPTEEGSGDA